MWKVLPTFVLSFNQTVTGWSSQDYGRVDSMLHEYLVNKKKLQKNLDMSFFVLTFVIQNKMFVLPYMGR